jgi:cyclopropane fatty-acyl-phospholipid synthase-like methyltransferase
MSAIQPRIYQAPFDAVALHYDESFTSSRIGTAQRSSVWHELEKSFRSGDRTLEIGCGTGVDACFLAARGIQVVACDSSPQMIAVAARRIRENGLQNSVWPLVLRAEDISSLPASELFDGAFSNFGVLNCIDDLTAFARDLSSRLKAGATALLCCMGHCCLWEILWYGAHRNREKAFRRLHHNGVTAKIADGAFLRVKYPTVHQIARAFAPEFRLISVKGIGVVVPPSYVEPWAQRHPSFMRFAERADLIVGRCPGFRLLADHVLVRFERVGASGAGKR